MTLAVPQQAYAFNAGEVLNKMESKERGAYLAGLVDGMAQSRWVRDKPDASGTQCIIDWFYKGGDAVQSRIEQWFRHHLEKPSNALLYVLVRKECGT